MPGFTPTERRAGSPRAGPGGGTERGRGSLGGSAPRDCDSRVRAGSPRLLHTPCSPCRAGRADPEEKASLRARKAGAELCSRQRWSLLPPTRHPSIIHPSACLSIHHPSIRLSIHPPVIYLLVLVSHQCTHPNAIHLSAHPFVCPPVHPSIRVPTHPIPLPSVLPFPGPSDVCCAISVRCETYNV